MRLRIFNRHRHYWVDANQLMQGYPDPKILFECSVCEKRIIRRPSQAPVNPLVPSAWDVYEQEVAHGNAHLVMAPPLVSIPEPDYIRGERYATLVREGKL